MPFDDRTITGYLVTLFIQIVPSYAICAIIFTVCATFSGLCWYIMALLDDLTSMLINMDNIYIKPSGATSNVFDKSYLLLDVVAKKHLDEIIKFHLRIITYKKKFANLFLNYEV